MKLSILKPFVFCLTLILFQLNTFSQQVIQESYTMDQANGEILKLQNEKQKINDRINNIKIDDSNGALFANVQNAILTIDTKIKFWEDIKTSIEFAEMNGVPTVPSTGTETDQLERNRLKDEYYSTHQLKVDKVKIKRENFNLLPEHKRQNILDHPNQYEIID